METMDSAKLGDAIKHMEADDPKTKPKICFITQKFIVFLNLFFRVANFGLNFLSF